MTPLKSWTFIDTVVLLGLPPPSCPLPTPPPPGINAFVNGVCVINKQVVLTLCFQETQVLGWGRAGPAGWEGIRRRGGGSRARL